MKKFLKNAVLILAVFFAIPLVFAGCEDEEEQQYNLEIRAVLVGDGITDGDKLTFQTKVTENRGAFTAGGEYAEQDRVDLKAPHITNYKFVGWYADAEGDGEWISSDLNHWWNMEYARDGYVEARYTPLCYNITYVFGDNNENTFTPTHQNPTSYNCIKNDNPFTLVAPTIEHFTFSQWHYFVDGQRFENFTTLPTLEEQLPRTNNFYNQNPIEDITIFCIYSPEQMTITLNYEHLTSISLWTGNAQDDCDKIEIINNQATIDYNKNLVIKYTAEDGYNIDSLKINDEPYLGASTTRCDIEHVTESITITIIPEYVG